MGRYGADMGGGFWASLGLTWGGVWGRYGVDMGGGCLGRYGAELGGVGGAMGLTWGLFGALWG